MTTKRTGSAKKNLPYHNALILHKSKNLTVKDQDDEKTLLGGRQFLSGHSQQVGSYHRR